MKYAGYVPVIAYVSVEVFPLAGADHDGHVDRAEFLKLLRDGGFRGWTMVNEWEVPDPYDACIKCKRAVGQAWGA